MKKKHTPLILGLALVVVLAVAGFAYTKLSATTEQTPGSTEEDVVIPAVDFTMENPEGDTLQFLDQLDGRPAVINFWASTCGPCKMEMPDFQAAFEEYGEEIQFFMVNVGSAMNGETREKADAYLEENNFTFPVYFDQNFSGVIAYGLRGFPATFFLDAEGNLEAYSNGMISADILQKGLNMIAPEVVEAP